MGSVAQTERTPNGVALLSAAILAPKARKLR